jgi:heterodisulfide reductase subunit A-like polyferredoxin
MYGRGRSDFVEPRLPYDGTSHERETVSTAIQTGCCIIGGGPAGMMLGFLLARMGGEVVVLEKHADFLRDFRGDTIYPSTLEVCSSLAS